MAKNKKTHDQEVNISHEGFREGVRKYSYAFANLGKVNSYYSNEEESYVVGQEVEGKLIRKIEQNWMYGTLCTLIFLEE